MEYRINKTWSPHAVITAVTGQRSDGTDGAFQRRSNRKHLGTLRAEKASRRNPEEEAKACIEAVETWLTEALQKEVHPKKTIEHGAKRREETWPAGCTSQGREGGGCQR